jgi:hypothetical protein
VRPFPAQRLSRTFPKPKVIISATISVTIAGGPPPFREILNFRYLQVHRRFSRAVSVSCNNDLMFSQLLEQRRGVGWFDGESRGISSHAPMSKTGGVLEIPVSRNPLLQLFKTPHSNLFVSNE